MDAARFIKMFSDETIKDLKKCNTNIVQMNTSPAKALLLPQNEDYGIEVMETEIYSTLAIESIDSSGESIRKMLKGYAPNGHQQDRIYNMKKGLEFVCEKNNVITEENIYQLY